MGQANSQVKPRFGAYSTAEQVAEGEDLHGKNIIVTGSNTGIGLETVRVLAKHGAFVVMACRDIQKAQSAEQKIKAELPEAQISVMELDLASLASIRKFVADFIALNKPLHILINNAGVMACPYAKTADGFEMQFGTNHLGHFLLTNLLLPCLRAGAPSRVVSVASLGHKFSGINWPDLQWEKSYSQWYAYSQSKSANILFAVEFNRRFSAEGIFANALHPGVIGATELSRYLPLGIGYLSDSWAVSALEKLSLLKTIPQGAATQVFVAIAPELERAGGLYFSDCQQAFPSPHASDPQEAAKLWEESVKLVGL